MYCRVDQSQGNKSPKYSKDRKYVNTDSIISKNHRKILKMKMLDRFYHEILSILFFINHNQTSIQLKLINF